MYRSANKKVCEIVLSSIVKKFSSYFQGLIKWQLNLSEILTDEMLQNPKEK